MNRAENTVAEIADICRDLVYISETDAPVLPFTGGPAETVSRDELVRITGSVDAGEVEEIGLDQFFGRLTVDREWYGDRERGQAEKFRKLKARLRSALTDPKVFRIGRVRIDIYVVGLDADGNLTGVSTRAVET